MTSLVNSTPGDTKGEGRGIIETVKLHCVLVCEVQNRAHMKQIRQRLARALNNVL